MRLSHCFEMVGKSFIFYSKMVPCWVFTRDTEIPPEPRS
jgi:hypothetical protein